MADLEQGAVNQLRGRLAMVEFERRVVPSRGLDGILYIKKRRQKQKKTNKQKRKEKEEKRERGRDRVI